MLSTRDERQKMIRPNCHPTYNERHQKIIEMIDWTWEKYKMITEKTQQQNEQVIIINNIIEELNKGIQEKSFSFLIKNIHQIFIPHFYKQQYVIIIF